MILSGSSIRARGIFTPFAERTKFLGMTYGVGPAGYDVRVDQDIKLPPGGFALASTLEHFDMPNDLMGIVHDKSTWARLGLAAQNRSAPRSRNGPFRGTTPIRAALVSCC
jgi:dCTP deaminase